jgi:3-deoxy-7-phosphoheptulonate synthase
MQLQQLRGLCAHTAATTTACTTLPLHQVGRMAGQFAKPRSDNWEERDGVKLPSYRGDIINGEAFTAEARENDPYRMIAAYHQSSQVCVFSW